MTRKDDVLMVFDFLIELLKTKEENIESPKVEVPETKTIIENTQKEEISSNLKHASELMRKIDEKDRIKAETNDIFKQERLNFKEHIKRMQEEFEEKQKEFRLDETKSLDNIPVGEFTSTLPKIEIVNGIDKPEERKKIIRKKQ